MKEPVTLSVPSGAAVGSSALFGDETARLLSAARKSKPRPKPDPKIKATAFGEITDTLKANGLTNRQIAAWYARKGHKLKLDAILFGWREWRKANGIRKPWE